MKCPALIWSTLNILIFNFRLNSAVNNDKQRNIPLPINPENISTKSYWHKEHDLQLANVFGRVNGDPKKVKAEMIRNNPEWKDVRFETLRRHVKKLVDRGWIKADEHILEKWKQKKHHWTEKDTKSLMHIWYDEYKGNVMRDYPRILEKWSQQHGKPHNVDETKLYNKMHKLLQEGYIVYPEQHGGVPVRVDYSTRDKRNQEERNRQLAELQRKQFAQASSSAKSKFVSTSHDRYPITQEFSNPAVAHHGHPNYGAAHLQPQVSEHHTSYWGDTSHVSSLDPHYNHGHYVHESNVHSEQFLNQGYHAQEPAAHQSQTSHGVSQFQDDSSFYDNLPSLHSQHSSTHPSFPTDNVFEFNWQKLLELQNSPTHL